MKLEEFNSKAESFGDFYVYYTKPGANYQLNLVGTTDFTPPYIADIVAKQVRSKTFKQAIHDMDREKEVIVFSYNSNKLRILPLNRIKRLVPLSSILKNQPLS